MSTRKKKIGTLDSYVQKYEYVLSTASVAEDMFQQVKVLHQNGTKFCAPSPDELRQQSNYLKQLKNVVKKVQYSGNSAMLADLVEQIICMDFCCNATY